MKFSQRHLTPLCFLPNGNLVCYKYGDILILRDGVLEKKLHLSDSKKERLFARFSLLFRALRLGIRTAISLDDENILLSIGNMLYEFNLTTGLLSNGYFCGQGVRPLIFTVVKGIKGIDDGIYFGTYQSVSSKNPVHIFKRQETDKWEPVYTFELGSVEHIHNIISDPYRNCLWVFNGDFGNNSAIWKVTENFGKVERMFYGSQKYRACVVNALPEGLLYATDSPLDDDYIFLLNPITGELKEVMPVSGSCIYGCQWKDQFIFETSVEPTGIYRNRLDMLTSRKRGPGIKDEYVRVYCGNLQNGFNVIYKKKKDRFPYATFQFGSVHFPYGNNNGNTLFFQPISVQEDDLLLKSINYSEL